jgi:hypothetical protein
MMIVTMVQSMYTQEILLPEVGATEHTNQDRHAVPRYITGKPIHNHYISNVQVVHTVMLLVLIPMMFIDVIMDIQFLLRKYGIGLVIFVGVLIIDRPIVHPPLVRVQQPDIIH